MPEFVDTVIIGGGQAGLAMSHHLRARGIEHVVLERARIAERWRSERWDSLRFQFPSAMMRLPGLHYDGPDPDGYMHRDDVVRFIVEYAVRSAAPVRSGVNVTRLHRAEDGRLRVEAGPSALEARNVVVATGPYQRPKLPDCAARLPTAIHQVTANRYTRPDELPAGAVLVVGSGASGCQIVEDLLVAGRRVFYALRGHRRMPRRYRGKDAGWWNEEMGATDRTADQLPANFRPPLVTGAHGARTVDLRALAARGATLLGSLRDIQDGRAVLEHDLNANLDAGDATFRAYLHQVDAYIARHDLDAAPPGEFDDALAVTPARLPEPATLDLRDAAIGTIIWALGYAYEFDWVHCPVLDAHGTPIQHRGVTAVQGLYFLGLMRMHKLKSAFMWGVGEDAAFLASRMTGEG